MSTAYKHILKFGKIRENWLENFPQHIKTKEQSYYQLIIDNKNNYLTLEFDLTNSEDLTIDLPLVTSYEYNCIVEWGDGFSSNIISATDINKKHTYLNPGIYLVQIIGTCSTFNNYEYEIENNGKNAWEYLTRILTWRRNRNFFII